MMAANQDPFATLGLPKTFALTADTLDATYRELAKEAHPDRFANAPAAERVVAMQRAMDYNEAYKKLRKPASRAEALLASYGVVIGEHERLDEATLMEVLEWREELAEARAAGDLAKVTGLERNMKQREAGLLAELGGALALAEAAASQAERAAHVAAAKGHLIVLRYVGRYLEECDAAISVLDGE